MTVSGETKTQAVRRNIIAGAITAAVVAAAAIGVPVVVNASNTAHAQEVQQISAAKNATAVTRAAGERDTTLTDSATQAGVIAQQEAEAKAAAAAQAAAEKAAADAAAAQAAQQAQAQAASDDDSDSSSSSSSSSASSGQPSGTPLPMAKVTDPNNGQFGQYVPTVDPASWCANHSASTINGVPTCD